MIRPSGKIEDKLNGKGKKHNSQGCAIFVSRRHSPYRSRSKEYRRAYNQRPDVKLRNIEYYRSRKEYFLLYRKNRRHLLGISKKYREEMGISYTKEYKKLYKQKRRSLERCGGKLSIQTIQQVYEDNIKKYGTLTCYLCLKPIEFSQDSLEHKIPLSRGGTNEYNNLAIAHIICNCRKRTKTYREYKKCI